MSRDDEQCSVRGLLFGLLPQAAGNETKETFVIAEYQTASGYLLSFTVHSFFELLASLFKYVVIRACSAKLV